MAVLHIEHPITDLDTWLGAFNNFAAARRQAGSSPDASPGLAGSPRAAIPSEIATK